MAISAEDYKPTHEFRKKKLIGNEKDKLYTDGAKTGKEVKG